MISFVNFALAVGIAVAIAQTSEAQYSRCFNPNQTPGVCISLYDCPPLFNIVASGMAGGQQRTFLQQSQCQGGSGRPPNVCCTNDVGYFRRRPNEEQPRGRASNVAFPQEPVSRTTRALDIPAPPVCGGISIENKIYGGDDANLNEFPWMVLLEYKKRNGGLGLNCAGSLINKRYIITAAHCVTGAIETQVGELVSARLGEYDISKKTDCVKGVCADTIVRLGVEEIIPHEGYDDKSPHRHNDIALVRLNRDVRYSKSIRPICLSSGMAASSGAQPSKELVVAGWGRTLRSAKSIVKQKLSVPLFDQEDCRRKFATRKVEVTDKQVCAGGVHAEDSCDGDSGGPLMRFQRNAWVLEGIVSFGVKCGLSGWPAVHTRVSSYDDWIRSKMR